MKNFLIKSVFNRQLLWRIMIMSKLCLFLLVSATLTSFAKDSYAQAVKLSMEMNQAPLGKVIGEIKRQTQFEFAYDSELESIIFEKVSISVNDADIEQILKTMLVNTGLTYKIIDRIILLSKKEMMTTFQGIPITGVITDESGDPLPGVNVVIKGTSNGAISDASGKFSIHVPNKETVLQFSFIGYTTQEFVIGNQTVINVSLAEETRELEEVVVVGYGTMRKIDLTGSVVSADLESFRDAPNVNILQSLQGSVPGLLISQTDQARNNEPGINIRGRNTINGSTGVLIVVDGIPYSGRIGDLNPADIQSVNVLKDASSKAIYGAEATNGVMLITTKTGKRSEKATITYSGSVGTSSPTKEVRLRNREEQLDIIRGISYKYSFLGPDYMQPDPNWTYRNSELAPDVLKGVENGADFDW